MLRRSIKVTLFCYALAFTTSGFAIDMVSTKGHSILFSTARWLNLRIGHL